MNKQLSPRTFLGLEALRNQPLPKCDEDFDCTKHRIVGVFMRAKYGVAVLPSWHHFDRVIRFGASVDHATGEEVITVIGVTAKGQTWLKVKKL